jgi:hypothetical protein
MALVLSEKSMKERPLVEAGAHPAICYSVIDMGTQKSTYQGETKELKKLRLSFEICDQNDDFEQVENGKVTIIKKPLVCSAEFTASIGPKASLRKFIEGWLGLALNSKQLTSFKVVDFLGKSALLNVVHKTSQTSGKVYAAIGSASKLPKGMVVPERVNNLTSYEIEQKQGGEFPNLPKWLQEKILMSKELGAIKPTIVSEDGVPF